MKLMGHIILPSFVHPSVCPFVKLFCACHILRTLHARVLKFYIWVPNEKIADHIFYAPNFEEARRRPIEELKIFGPVYFPWLLRGCVKRTAYTPLKFINSENIYFFN